MSDTPLTDSVKVRKPRGLWIVNADYMQQVERENSALRDHAERLAEALEKIVEIEDGNGMAVIGWTDAMDKSRQALTLYRAENTKL